MKEKGVCRIKGVTLYVDKEMTDKIEVEIEEILNHIVTKNYKFKDDEALFIQNILKSKIRYST